MITPKKCPECGSTVEHTHEPSYQEYPGASVQPATHSIDCTKCEWYTSEVGESIQGQENTRGY